MVESIKLFSKSLTETDTKKRLAIPTKILPAMSHFNQNHEIKLHLLYGTKVWPIVCSVRKLKYKKPVFSGGWRNFVVCNNLSVGDELTLYKVHDEEAGSSYYKVEVEKPAAKAYDPDLSPRAVSVSCIANIHDNFELYAQKQPCKVQHALIKEEGAVIANVAAEDDVPVTFHDQVIISKPPCWLFGTNLSEEATSKAQFKTEPETQSNFITGISTMCRSEPPAPSFYMTSKEEKEIKLFGRTSGIQTAGEAYCCKTGTERQSLDLVLAMGQPTQYAGEVNLDLTLALPTGSTSLCSLETMVGC